MKLHDQKVLVLNSDYSPFSIISWRTAFVKLFSGNVYCVSYYEDFVVDSKMRKHAIPAVLVLKDYINISSKKSPFTKKNIFLRDEYTCQYCSYKFKPPYLQIDHIIPKSKSHLLPPNIKLNSYENLTTSCAYCNSKKADRTPEQAGMQLLSVPKSINRSQKIVLEIKSRPIPKEWNLFLKVEDDSQTNKETVCTSK